MWFYIIFSTIIIGTVTADLDAQFFEAVDHATSILEAAHKQFEGRVLDFITELQQQCERTGNAEIFNKLQSTGAVDSCKFSIIEYHDNVQKAMKSNYYIQEPHMNSIRTISAMCPMLENDNSTCARVAEELMPCLSGNDSSVGVLNVFLLIKPLAQYACKEGGKLIQSFIGGGGPECIQANYNNLLGCLSIMEEKRIPLFKVEECTRIDEMQRCLLGVFAKCRTSLALALEPLAARLKKVTPCGKTNETDSNTGALETAIRKEPQELVAPIDTERLEPTTFRHLLDIIDRKLETKNDDLDLFGKYLVASLRKLSNRNSNQAENEVQNILYKYKMRDISDKEWMTRTEQSI